MSQIRILVFLFIVAIFTHYTTPRVAANDSLSPRPLPRVHHGKSVVSPAAAIILACLVSTFLLTCCFSIYVHQCVHRHMSLAFPGHAFRQGQLPWREEAATRGVDPRVVASFPAFVYAEVKELKIGECALECAMCLNEFRDEETLQLLPRCWHVFHPDCIQSWLSSHVTCPVCRADLVSGPNETCPRVPVTSQNPELEPDVPTMDHGNLADEITVVDSTAKSLMPRSMSRDERILRATFRKSFSTGHSLVLPVENCERFTLRLPEEVRNRLVNSGLERATSCHVAFPRARSGRKGFRSTSNGGGYDRFDGDGPVQRWVFTATPPFFSRAGPSRPTVTRGSGSGGDGTKPVGLFKSVTSPINRLLRGHNMQKDDLDLEDRSTDVLVMDSKV